MTVNSVLNYTRLRTASKYTAEIQRKAANYQGKHI